MSCNSRVVLQMEETRTQSGWDNDLLRAIQMCLPNWETRIVVIKDSVLSTQVGKLPAFGILCLLGDEFLQLECLG
jgi:hypothetical protein